MEQKEYIPVVPLNIYPSPYGCTGFFRTPQKIFSINMDGTKLDNIKWALEDFVCGRPTTFEFIREMLGAINCELVRVDFYNEEDGIFYTRVTLSLQGVFQNKIVEIDARPSDSIPLAIRCGTAMFIDKAVLDRLQDVSSAYQKLKTLQ